MFFSCILIKLFFFQLAAAQERERTAAEQYVQASSKTAALESKLSAAQRDRTQLETRLESEERRRAEAESEAGRASSQAERAREEAARELAEAKKEKEFAEAAAAAEKAEAGAERRKALALAEQLRDRDRRIRETQQELDLVRASTSSQHNNQRGVSPTPSQLSQLSVNGSAAAGADGSFAWPVRMFFIIISG